MYIDKETGCKCIDLSENHTLVLSDVDNSVQNFEDYIGEIGWQYEDFAVRKIFKENIIAKSDINALLRNHPNYVENLKGIVVDGSFTRDVDIYTASQFSHWLDRQTQSLCLEKGLDRYCMSDAVYYLTARYVPTMANDAEIDILENIFKNHPELGLQKLHVHKGQKRSKIVGKFCRMLGIDKCDEFQQMFAKYGDAINPIKINLPTLITTNANDFVRMSDGAGGWRSCHNPDKSAYEGCNCSGGISHALDNTSIIMYTVKESSNGNYQIQKKVDRCIFFAGRDSGEKIAWFVQSKVYPDGTEQKSDEFRTIFQKVLSECMGIPNLWTKGKMSDDWATIYSHDDSTAYPDFEYCDRNIIVPFRPSDVNTENFQSIIVGAAPICVECGYHHSFKDEINCCNFFHGGSVCPNCGTHLDSEGDEIYSDFHDEYGCVECMSYNSVAEDYFYTSDREAWVENISEYVPICYMEYHDEEFQRCQECGRWIFVGRHGWYGSHNEGSMVDVDGNYYCNSCGEAVLYPCADCGELFKKEDVVEINGEYYCNDCAENHDDHSTAIA